MATLRSILLLILLALLASGNGCSYFRNSLDHNRLENGYVLVLPGIEGASLFNANVASVLKKETAAQVELHDWTTNFPPAFLIHLRSQAFHDHAARIVAEKIMNYQLQYPGRPVTIVGHSGGGALAVHVLEILPPENRIDRAILLAPALAPRHDLELAISRADNGIWNFYGGGDIPLEVIGTTIVGTYDGKHVPAAGAIGFRNDCDEVYGDLNALEFLPQCCGSESSDPRLYGPGLRQLDYVPEMLLAANWGGHFGWTSRRFVREYLRPLVGPCRCDR